MTDSCLVPSPDPTPTPPPTSTSASTDTAAAPGGAPLPRRSGGAGCPGLPDAEREKIAIIGIGCRLPGGANDHRAYWRNLVDGKDCITPTPRSRYDVTTLGSRDKAKPGRLVGGRGGYIDGFDEFDPAFFGISGREADHMDPQQRKLLEVAWEALEDGGQKPAELAGRDVGVYVGAFTLDYKIVQFSDLSFDTLAAHTATGTMMTMVSNRISHCFDFRGPSVSLDTACSSSLVAVHLAGQSLLRGETDLALAGGTLLHIAPQYTIAETKGGFLSPQGRSRTFDAAADGYVRAEGVAIVALKRLSDAVRDGDPVHAVIIGSGVNQDGRTNGITVPNPDAQVALIERVCAEAGIVPGSLQYVEAHGTSTPVGDPIEATALARALSVGRRPGDRCYVGSVKTNIGHTESAAGLAGLIKSALALKHRLIPPHINLERLNPAIDPAALPYEIPTEPTPWPAHRGPARAGVNSFGFGGTNAHVLLEAAPEPEPEPEPGPQPVGAGSAERAVAPHSTRTEAGGEGEEAVGGGEGGEAQAPVVLEGPGDGVVEVGAASPVWTVLPLSARDTAALPEVAAGIQGELAGVRGGDPARPADVGHTLAHRRQHHDARLSVVYDSRGAAARASLDEALSAYLRGEPHPRVLTDHRREPRHRRLAWVFTGMGPQWWAMGRQLLATEPVYREAVERCAEHIAELTGWSLTEELGADEADSRMAETWLAQPANFAVQVGLAALWRSRGVHPDAVVGHSTGEVAAFHEAGVYDLADAVKVVVHRSRLQQRLAGTGGMLAVALGEAEAVRRLRPYGDAISVAAVNSPTSLTLAGDETALAELAAALTAEQVFVRPLAVEVPYHSARMELIKDELLESLADLKPRPARVPLHLTGREGTARGTELDAAYWWHNVRDRVRFRQAVERLTDDGYRLFLEVGPHPVLGRSIAETAEHRTAGGNGDGRSAAADAPDVRTLPSIRRREDEQVTFTASLAALHNLGVEVDWSVLQPAGRAVPLPRYPFRRDRHWVEPRPVAVVRQGRLDHPLLGRRLPGAEPAWEARLDAEALPYLEDHRIQGSVLFPAAGYLEMAVQAVRALTGGADAALAGIELRKALFLPDAESRAVQLTLSTEHGGFTVATPAGQGTERTVHAVGTVRPGQSRRPARPLAVTALRERAVRHLTGPECYTELAALGYHYGPAFQGIEEVWIGAGEALARIRPTSAVVGQGVDHQVHPVVMDALFQTLLTPQLATAGPSGAGIRLPVAIEEVRLDAVGDRTLWAHATVTDDTGAELVGDIAVHDEHGVPLGGITGFRAADVEQAATAVAPATIDGWLAEPVWAPLPDAPDLSDASDLPLGHADDWLVFADGQGVAEALAQRITARGGRCLLVRPGAGYRPAEGDDPAVVDPGSAADLARLLADHRASGAPDPAAVVHLWNLDRPELSNPADPTSPGGHATPVARTAAADFSTTADSSDTLAPVTTTASATSPTPSDTSPGAYNLVVLAALMSAELPGSRLHIVTRRAQATVAGEPVEPMGAPAWGIGRVLRHQELPGHPGKLVDLGPDGDRDGEAAALLREFTLGDEDEIALRDGRRLTCRLRRAEGLSRPLPPRLRPDAAYLVTGAFGALGRLLCRTLVRRGARRLILVGRGPLPPREEWRDVDPTGPEGLRVAFLRELEALGAEPVPARLDITDESALAAWLTEYRRLHRPPIRGVFHLAGQVRDTLVGELDRETFDAAYDPKVLGALALHRQLAGEPLDHFVLFASIASLLTTAGQTNYAAGNAFLDALAHHRRALGLPALSLDWGPWATGMIEELGLIDHYRASRGMSSLAPETGMAVLERVLGQDRAQLLIATVVDWPVFLSWYPAPPPLVADLAAAARESGPAAEPTGPLETLRAAGEAERLSLLTGWFGGLVASVLRVPADQIDPGTGLGTLGLDSLLAMELRARLTTELGTTLPLVALLSNAPVAELVAQLYESLAELLHEERPDRGGTGVERYEDESSYPLTQNQKALWFLKQLDPDGFAYNIGGAVEVRVELEPELMALAFRTMVERHPGLRANFVLDDGGPVQRISAAVEPDFGVVDVEHLDWDEIHAMIVREYRRPYDLERDPLVRFRLFRRGPARWVIMKAVHHIVSDAISTFTFIEELLAVYEGLRRGEAPRLPPVSARYLDFLNRQNEFLAGREASRMLDYWRSRLPAEVPTLELPTDRPRPAVQTHNGASEFFVLDEELSARVHALAREHNVTVFMVLLSAYYLLLHAYSGQDDLIVGSPVTGRTDEEFAGVYGYFVNPLPLYVSLAGEPTVAELLDRVRTTVLGGLDHQEYPFVLLVEKLGLQHDPSRSAVFQAMFILLHHKVATEKYGYRLEYIELPEEEGQFDLTLSAYEDESEHRFHCVLKYNTDLFLPETVARLAGHYVNLLTALTTSGPERAATGLELLGPDERALTLGRWSGADRRVAYDEPVHELILRAAAADPTAPAVVMPAGPCPAVRLTYGELAERSARAAARLRALGAGPGSVVALCLEKSPELIVALLAVLRTGAAYLPLAPGDPADRLAYMVEHAGADLLITDDHDRLDRLDGLDGLPARLITTGELGTAAAEFADEPVGLEAPAYVIHTSGSSGRPKAVRVSHGNLASAYQAWRAEYRLDTDVRVHLQMAAPSFDVFTGDVVRALCSGGTLVLVGRELLFDTARLHEVMRAERVDAAEFVPAVARVLAEHCERDGLRLDFMRLLVVGSDVWKVEEYERLRALCGPATRLVNSYGLTEATIDSAYFEGPVDGLEPSRMVPIGRPFPNSTLYLLDRHGRPVPPGVTGELWIGGSGVALGYAGDEERTARRFTTLPLGGADGTEPVQVYRTGDLACWDADGRVRLLGRADTQIKVRGHRIEPGEIESRLAEWPELDRAVVTVRADGRGENTLCAYCVPAPGRTLDRRELRRHLAGLLPTFMIPAHFTEVPVLPLTANGKVDLAALPAPATDGVERTAEPPATLYEVRMAEHWQALLGIEKPGLQHDFFECGGSSIRLIELVHGLQAEFNITVPVSRLFEVTTLHGMARTVEHIITGRIEGGRPYLWFNREQRQTLFCFPPAGGHGLVYRRFAEHLPEYRLVAFNYVSGDGKVDAYADLVGSLQPEGPCALLGYSLGGNLAFEVAKELERRGRTVSHVVIVDSHRIAEPFDLAEEHVAAFERELEEHLWRHTGSTAVADETRAQARDYLRFCSRTPNVGVITAEIGVISDAEQAALHEAGYHGAWHGSSATRTTVLTGHGTHAEMLDHEFTDHNARLTRSILTGTPPHTP
ncbi:amino acid adenylation domain-containing protein [Streptomyces sp. NPDC008159]|uniref:non-ribosomal peptide synthetase/type I polyketide synthase n=1 Tax=Streptomyces sp. NPDC008159 TaxID=3364817 RepID=UPI0036F16424